jgi:hypothetical protein
MVPVTVFKWCVITKTSVIFFWYVFFFFKGTHFIYDTGNGRKIFYNGAGTGPIN